MCSTLELYYAFWWCNAQGNMLRGPTQRITLRFVPMPSSLAPELRKELLETAVALGTQADLARALGTDPASVSRWLADEQGMEVGSCLKFALLRGKRPEDILRWAGYPPEDYLPSNIALSDEAREIAMRSRGRILEWQRKRDAIPDEFKPLADATVSRILDAYRHACGDR